MNTEFATDAVPDEDEADEAIEEAPEDVPAAPVDEAPEAEEGGDDDEYNYDDEEFEDYDDDFEDEEDDDEDDEEKHDSGNYESARSKMEKAREAEVEDKYNFPLPFNAQCNIFFPGNVRGEEGHDQGKFISLPEDSTCYARGAGWGRV